MSDLNADHETQASMNAWAVSAIPGSDVRIAIRAREELGELMQVVNDKRPSTEEIIEKAVAILVVFARLGTLLNTSLILTTCPESTIGKHKPHIPAMMALVQTRDFVDALVKQRLEGCSMEGKLSGLIQEIWSLVQAVITRVDGDVQHAVDSTMAKYRQRVWATDHDDGLTRHQRTGMPHHRGAESHHRGALIGA